MGNVFALLGRRVLGGKPGVSGPGIEPPFSLARVKRNTAAIFYL